MESLNYLGKTKQELTQQIQQFYYKKAVPLLPQLEEERSRNNSKTNIIAGIFLTFAISWLIVLFHSLECAVVILAIGLLLVPLSLLFVKKDEKIKDYDFLLKIKLMPEFLSLFGNFKWGKSEFFVGNYFFILNELKKLRILSINLLFLFDDIVEGTYNDISLKITELRTGAKALHVGKMLIDISFIVIYATFGFLPIFYVCKFMIINNMLPVLFNTFLPLILVLSISALLPVICFIIYVFLSTSFKAIIVEFDIPKNFSGTTCIFEKSLTSKKLINKKISNMKTVHLEDVKFSMLYDVYSTDQIEARYLLTTAFIERFKNIKTAFKAEYIRAQFDQNKLILLIGTDKDLFSMGSLSEKTTLNTFVDIFEELYSILSLIDELKLNQKIGL